MLRWYLTPYISFHIFIISYVNFEIFPNEFPFQNRVWNESIVTEPV